jgi:hypothetical protein
MATQIQTRKQRGDMIAPEDIVEMNASSFFVRSQTGKSGYAVTRGGQDWVCDCPDHKYRQVECKHIHAVQTQISKLSTEPVWSCPLGLWEASK